MSALDKMKAYTRTQTTELLIATLTQIEESAGTKTLRCGMEIKDFSREQRIARGVIYTVIEEREGSEMVDTLMDAFELVTA